MSDARPVTPTLPPGLDAPSDGVRVELEALGLDASATMIEPDRVGQARAAGRGMPKRAISAPEVLGEAYDYAKPGSFARGVRVPLGRATMLLLSGTASVNERGHTLYPGDFPAQCLRTLRNLTRLLVAEKASWHDVARTTCFLRDIERDYDSFNRIRTIFMNAIGLDPLPASTAVQAHLCRTDLLIEIEAIAFVPDEQERQ